MKYFAIIALLGLGAIGGVTFNSSIRPATKMNTIGADTADVKTCGCKKDASCGDCCGPKHCRCNPN